MATDQTDAFAADAGTVTPSREELERQLAELDRQMAPEDAGTTVAVSEPSGVDSVVQDEEAAPRETITVYNELLGRDITIIPPTDVDVMFYNQRMESRRLSDSKRMAATGDFCADHINEDDYFDWEMAIRSRADREPNKGLVFFAEALEELMNQIVDSSKNTDDSELKQATNRAQRRAALRAKKQRVEKAE